jgi:hypothetical protein
VDRLQETRVQDGRDLCQVVQEKNTVGKSDR